MNTCLTCRYFNPPPAEQANQPGLCRRNPPQVIVVNMSRPATNAERLNGAPEVLTQQIIQGMFAPVPGDMPGCGMHAVPIKGA